MSYPKFPYPDDPLIEQFLFRKREPTLMLLHHFLIQCHKCGDINIHPTKSMLGLVYKQRKIAWITQLGNNFVHIVFPFPIAYPDNFCFQKIAQVPGDQQQFNHHLRIYHPEDINEEVIKFIGIALA